MDRSNILSSPEYWIAKTQIDLYNCAEAFMAENNINRTQLANRLGVSKGYVSQLLNGDYDHRLSKLIELALAFGFVPKIEFKPIAEVISADRCRFNQPSQITDIDYVSGCSTPTKRFQDTGSFESLSSIINPSVA